MQEFGSEAFLLFVFYTNQSYLRKSVLPWKYKKTPKKPKPRFLNKSYYLLKKSLCRVFQHTIPPPPIWKCIISFSLWKKQRFGTNCSPNPSDSSVIRPLSYNQSKPPGLARAALRAGETSWDSTGLKTHIVQGTEAMGAPSYSSGSCSKKRGSDEEDSG